MQQGKINLVVYRALSGINRVRVGKSVYIIKPPTAEQKYIAQCIYNDVIEKLKFDTENYLSDRQALSILIIRKIVPHDIDKVIKEISTRIDDLKVQLYDNAIKGDKVLDKIRKELKLVKNKLEKKILQRNSLRHMTLDGHAESVKQKYLLHLTTETIDGLKVFPEWETLNTRLMTSLVEKINEQTPSIEEYRKVVRSEPWKSYWSARQADVFPCPTGNLNDEQITLILLSKMYDGAHSHPECPPDNIIENDDMFDGWMIKCRRESDKSKSDREVEEKIVSKIKGNKREANEYFVPVETWEEAKRINDYNDAGGKAVKAQRRKMMEAMGKVDEMKLPDVQVKRQVAANQKFVENMRNRKG